MSVRTRYAAIRRLPDLAWRIRAGLAMLGAVAFFIAVLMVTGPAIVAEMAL